VYLNNIAHRALIFDFVYICILILTDVRVTALHYLNVNVTVLIKFSF